jgi:hypothetical protein
MQNMETLLAWTTLVVVTRTARQGGRSSIGMTEEAKTGLSRTGYAHVGLASKGEEGMWNHFNLGIAIDERRPSLGAPKAVAHRSTATKAATRYCQMVSGE